MKGIMITGANSNSGKTTISFGLARALKDRGIDVSCFKTGPDYIDTKYLAMASKKEAGNLDMHLMGEENIRLAIGMNKGEFALIEGAMGYFDGIYNSFYNSSYDISKEINSSAILVYSPQGEMFTAIPKIRGMIDFPGSKIEAIILNKINEKIYLMLKDQIQHYTGLKVLGYIPKDLDLEISSRHLGLIQAEENIETEDIIKKSADLIEKYIDIDEILRIATKIEYKMPIKNKKTKITVAIAYDNAFNFYYSENLKLLEETCKVVYFSPLGDDSVPDCDLIYIGGGYPELYKEELSLNNTMIKSIKDAINTGVFVFAECGGLMYLCEEIEDHKMIGVIKAKALMTNSLQRFGYVDVELKEDLFIGRKGTKFQAHEFHRSIVETDMEGKLHIKKTLGDKQWSCGYVNELGNVFASYTHINFLGNLSAFKYMLNYIENKRRNKECI